jgi:hypothetical protein
VSESRLTFRGKCEGVAWQKQLRDHYEQEGTPPVPHLDVKRAQVRPVSRRMAEQVILKYEWLGTLGNTQLYFGIFFGDYCAGVTCIGTTAGGANVNAHMEWGVKRGEMAYLARGANVHWSPVGANSKLVSWTCKLLPKHSNCKIIIAYSDTDAGEIGTIYQACNWIYVGKGSSTNQWIAPNGRIYDQKLPYNLAHTERGGTRGQWTEALRKAGWKEQKSNPKHRYVYILDRNDKALVDRVERMRKPYPKRQICAGSIDSDAPVIQTGEGGVSPTPALQNQVK